MADSAQEEQEYVLAEGRFAQRYVLKKLQKVSLQKSSIARFIIAGAEDRHRLQVRGRGWMWATRWAHVTTRLVESFYVAANLITRNLLLSCATALRKKAEKREVQAGRLLAVTLEYPVSQFTSVRGRDILQPPSEL